MQMGGPNILEPKGPPPHIYPLQGIYLKTGGPNILETNGALPIYINFKTLTNRGNQLKTHIPESIPEYLGPPSMKELSLKKKSGVLLYFFHSYQEPDMPRMYLQQCR